MRNFMIHGYHNVEETPKLFVISNKCSRAGSRAEIFGLGFPLCVLSIYTSSSLTVSYTFCRTGQSECRC